MRSEDAQPISATPGELSNPLTASYLIPLFPHDTSSASRIFPSLSSSFCSLQFAVSLVDGGIGAGVGAGWTEQSVDVTCIVLSVLCRGWGQKLWYCVVSRSWAQNPFPPVL